MIAFEVTQLATLQQRDSAGGEVMKFPIEGHFFSFWNMIMPNSCTPQD